MCNTAYAHLSVRFFLRTAISYIYLGAFRVTFEVDQMLDFCFAKQNEGLIYKFYRTDLEDRSSGLYIFLQFTQRGYTEVTNSSEVTKVWYNAREMWIDATAKASIVFAISLWADAWVNSIVRNRSERLGGTRVSGLTKPIIKEHRTVVQQHVLSVYCILVGFSSWLMRAWRNPVWWFHGAILCSGYRT